MITHEGSSREKKETRNLKPDAENPPTVATLTEGRRKQVLPFVDASAAVLGAAIDNARGAMKNKQNAAKNGEARKRRPAGAGAANIKPGAIGPK